MLKVLQGWLWAIRRLPAAWFHRRPSPQRPSHIELRGRGSAVVNAGHPESGQPRPPTTAPCEKPGSEVAWLRPGSGAFYYLAIADFPQPIHDLGNKLVEIRDHSGPEHQIGKGHHRLAPVDALKALIAKTRHKFCLFAERLQISIHVQEVLTNPVCDRMLQFSSTLLRRFNLVRQQARARAAELPPVLGKRTRFKHRATRFGRSRHEKTIPELDQNQLNIHHMRGFFCP